MSEVKPCPFCGQMPQVDFFQHRATVSCQNLTCGIVVVSYCDADEDVAKLNAVAKWNARALVKDGK